MFVDVGAGFGIGVVFFFVLDELGVVVFRSFVFTIVARIIIIIIDEVGIQRLPSL